MNIEEYISSGILESYVLGELTESEVAEVRKMIDQHPEIRDEIEAIELSLEALAHKVAVKPSESVKANIYKDLKFVEPTENNSIPAHDNVRQLRTFQYVAAASVVLMLLSSALAYNYYAQWKNTESELSTLIAQNARVAEDFNKVSKELESVKGTLEITTSAAFASITMNGTDNAPDVAARIYWNARSQEVYLDKGSLKPIEQGKEYQLWAIVDGQPVDAGVFNIASLESLQKMKSIANASAFAVTIEPSGGSVSPTLETMQVIGEV